MWPLSNYFGHILLMLYRQQVTMYYDNWFVFIVGLLVHNVQC